MDSHLDLAKLTREIVSIACSAGRTILKIYESDFTIETKADQSPLTAADRAAHNLIVEELGKLTPETPVWSEESATIPYAERADWPEFWLVDPLDGTKEFIKTQRRIYRQHCLDQGARAGSRGCPRTRIKSSLFCLSGRWRVRAGRRITARNNIDLSKRAHAGARRGQPLSRRKHAAGVSRCGGTACAGSYGEFP